MKASVEPSHQAFGLPLYDALPEVPYVRLQVHGRQQHAPTGYLSLCRHALSIEEPSVTGDAAAVFLYDEVKRQSLDAAIIAPYFLYQEQFWVILRSAARPPLELREPISQGGETEPSRGLWEVPAGLIDSHFMTTEEPIEAARRELHEETGFALEMNELIPLGPPGYPCPGVIAEKQYFFRALLTDEHQRQKMPLDGSPLESVGQVIAVPLTQALLAIEQGLLQDLKTEVCLTRLARYLRV